MKISIGILAYNEEDAISQILHSLLKQSLFQNNNSDRVVEVVVVPNGCKDDTALVAKNTLDDLAKEVDSASFKWQVCEVSEAGKSNAWNCFIHQFSAPDTDIFYLMDADIKLHDREALEKMLEASIENPEKWIVLDCPIKDVELKEDKNFIEKLSVAVSKSSNKGQLYICGQLYCGRASVLRSIWMPPGLPVEDGFLTQMIISENGRIKNPTFKRIMRVMEASHVFEAYTNPFKLIDHEVRVTIGIVINIYLSNFLREKCSKELTAGELISRMNQKNHYWLDDFVTDNVASQGAWVIPISLVFRRYRSLKNHSLINAILRLPIATLAFLVDSIIFIRANNRLHRRTITNYW